MSKTALIIDDDRSVLKNFSRLLEENGFEVSGVTTGKEALDEVNHRNFDLLLIDFKLPDIDGTDLVEKMGKSAKSSVKFMITGLATLETRVRALELGIDGFIEKPVSPDELISLIEEKISQKKQERE